MAGSRRQSPVPTHSEGPGEVTSPVIWHQPLRDWEKGRRREKEEKEEEGRRGRGMREETEEKAHAEGVRERFAVNHPVVVSISGVRELFRRAFLSVRTVSPHISSVGWWGRVGS